MFSSYTLFYDFAFNAGNDYSITAASTSRYIQKSFISSQKILDTIGRAKAEICKPYEKQSHYDGIEPWIKEMTKEELEYCLAHASVWEKNGSKDDE